MFVRLLILCLSTFSATSVLAQTVLKSANQAAEICGAEKNSNDVDDDTFERIHSTKFYAAQIPIIDYDRTTGLLSFNIYKDIPLMEGYALRITDPAGLAFELSEEDASEIMSRYAAGVHHLEIEFVPSSFAEQTKSGCEHKKHTDVILATLLVARMVDREGTQIAKFETKMSRTIRLRKSQAIKAYMSAATPKVEVSAMKVETTLGHPMELSRPFQADISQKLSQSFLGCYTNGLAKNQRLQGALVVQIDVVKGNAQTLLTTMKQDDVDDCLLKRAKQFVAAFQAHNSKIGKVKINAVFKLIEDGSL